MYKAPNSTWHRIDVQQWSALLPISQDQMPQVPVVDKDDQQAAQAACK